MLGNNESSKKMDRIMEVRGSRECFKETEIIKSFIKIGNDT